MKIRKKVRRGLSDLSPGELENIAITVADALRLMEWVKGQNRLGRKIHIESADGAKLENPDGTRLDLDVNSIETGRT